MNNGMNLAGVENLFLINGEPHAGWTGLAVPVWQQQATYIRLAVRVHELHGPGILTVDTDDTSNAEARSPVAYLDAVEQFSRERIEVVPI